jgi:hypothetical protein
MGLHNYTSDLNPQRALWQEYARRSRSYGQDRILRWEMLVFVPGEVFRDRHVFYVGFAPTVGLDLIVKGSGLWMFGACYDIAYVLAYCRASNLPETSVAILERELRRFAFARVGARTISRRKQRSAHKVLARSAPHVPMDRQGTILPLP